MKHLKNGEISAHVNVPKRMKLQALDEGGLAHVGGLLLVALLLNLGPVQHLQELGCLGPHSEMTNIFFLFSYRNF